MAALFVRKLGDRGTTIIGAVLSTAALLVSALLFHLNVKEIFAFYIITGGLVGVGFGLMYLPAMSIIDHWFDRNLGFATGIAAAGSGIGQSALAPLSQLMIKSIGLTWTFVVLASVTATGIIFGMFYTIPVAEVGEQEEQSKEKSAAGQSVLQIIKTKEFPLVVISTILFYFGVWTVFQFSSVGII